MADTSIAVKSNFLRREVVGSPVPVDADSRLQLIRFDHLTEDFEPIFPEVIKNALNQIVKEHKNLEKLLSLGLNPTRSAIFTGAPGVGKTLSAKWLARELGLPLMTLDLSAVMSSYLGKTGTNLRYVLDYAKSQPSVLLLDEFDSIAKRRDDEGDLGELKRLVNVLLQEIENWPPHGILIAATNHPNLLDPAVWRRFEQRIEFPMPSAKDARQIILQMVPASLDGKLVDGIAEILVSHSFSDIKRFLNGALRKAAISNMSLEDSLRKDILSYIEAMEKPRRLKVAIDLIQNSDLSQRDINKITGISRDTLRKYSETTH